MVLSGVHQAVWSSPLKFSPVEEKPKNEQVIGRFKCANSTNLSQVLLFATTAPTLGQFHVLP